MNTVLYYCIASYKSVTSRTKIFISKGGHSPILCIFAKKMTTRYYGPVQEARNSSEIVSDTLKAFFKKNKISYTQLSDILGITPQTISYHLSGEKLLNKDIAKKLSDAFGFNFDYLVKGPYETVFDEKSGIACDIEHFLNAEAELEAYNGYLKCEEDFQNMSTEDALDEIDKMLKNIQDEQREIIKKLNVILPVFRDLQQLQDVASEIDKKVIAIASITEILRHK